MDFKKVEQIVSNRLTAPEDTEKAAEKLVKKAIETEKKQKEPKKDTLTDMQKLATAKNFVSAMVKKAKQQSGEKTNKASKHSTNKTTTTKKEGK